MTMAGDLAERVDMFLAASVGGPLRRAAMLLAQDPSIATYDFRTAVVLGMVSRVRELLAADPGLALRRDGRSGWPPLLGVCSSRWHRVDPVRAEGLLAVARLLLDAGAEPNTRAGESGQRGHCSTLFGAAGCASNPAITRLLERGAIPEDHTLYLAAFFPDHECLRLLLPYMADLAGSTALATPISVNDLDGVRLLDAGVDPDRPLSADLFGELDRRAADRHGGRRRRGRLRRRVGGVAAAARCRPHHGGSGRLVTLSAGVAPGAPGRGRAAGPPRRGGRRLQPDMS
jgi:hypothetical protein